ncbi:MAG: YIP1 family protein [Halobacteria archaeon]
MAAFLRHLSLVLHRPREAFRGAAEEPRPWEGVLWGLLPAFLGLFLTAWAATRRWFDPWYSGLAGLIFGGFWVLSLFSLAVSARLLGGRPKSASMVEASALAWTPVLAGMLAMTPVFLTTEGRNFAILQRPLLFAVMGAGTLWGALLSFLLFREVAGFTPRRALGGYLLSLVISGAAGTAAGVLFVWNH